jgi:23S rRNA (uracil747-C5)-methyltransferase
MKTFCRYFNESICQSCDLIHLDYKEQLHHKEVVLQKSLKGVNLPALEKSVVSPETHFRNKAKFSVTGTLDHPVIGLTGSDALDEGRELLECSLHVSEINALLPVLKSFITTAGLVPYSIGKKKGELKGIIIFHSEKSHESYVRFILRSKESIDRIKKFSSELLKDCPTIKCLSVNIQPVPHAILEGDEEVFVTEARAINHPIGKIILSLGPQAFVQTNQVVASQLYETAARWIKESGLKKFMELFCGQGAFSFYAANAIQEGLGIEINPEAVKEANKTARMNQLSHLSFKSADASNVQSELNTFGPDIVLVNPPRRGLAQSCEHLMATKPAMIIYSSCNYLTLASDIEKLNELYEVKKIQIFDMFPHTSHFETLVQLTLRDG